TGRAARYRDRGIRGGGRARFSECRRNSPLVSQQFPLRLIDWIDSGGLQDVAVVAGGVLGGINWSSQHNREECCDGRETAVGSSVTGQVEVARAAGDGAT